MKAKCPQCGHQLTIDDLIEPERISICQGCEASFDAEAHRQEELSKAEIKQESYVVDWQI
jgi:DNA-directed RNA polymerase subunit M/transcription elongation factor TFIIS